MRRSIDSVSAPASQSRYGPFGGVSCLSLLRTVERRQRGPDGLLSVDLIMPQRLNVRVSYNFPLHAFVE